MNRLAALSLFLIAFVQAASSAQPASAQDRIVITEERIAALPPGVPISDIIVSRSGSFLAYASVKDGSARVVQNGVAGPTFDSVRDLAYTGGGDVLRYVAQRGSGYWFVSAGAQSGPWEAIKIPYLGDESIDAPPFCLGSRDGKERLVLAGTKDGPAFDEIPELVCADGEIAYIGHSGGLYSVMWGDRRYDYAIKVDSLGLAPFEGELHIAWLVHDSAGSSLVVDGARGPSYDELGASMAYNAIGSKKPLYGYEARKGKSWLYVANGAESPAFEEVSLDSLVLSSDGNMIGFAGLDARGWTFHRRGAVEGPYADFYTAFLLPDLQSIISFAVDQNDMSVLSVDGKAAKPYENHGYFPHLTSFPPAPGRWAVVGKRGPTWTVQTDQGETKPYSRISGLAYSTDGRLRLVVEEAEGRYVVEGDTRYGPFEDARFLSVGLGVQRIAFEGFVSIAMVTDGGKTSFLAGSKRSPSYDRVLYFDQDMRKSFVFYGMRGAELWRGRIALP